MKSRSKCTFSVVLTIAILFPWSASIIVAQVAAPTAERVNVPAGINDAFLDESLDPQEWVARFEVESREIFAARDQIVQALQLRDGQCIADIGCGTGLFIPLFHRAVAPGGKVYAVDIAPRLLDFVQQRVDELGSKDVEVVRCEVDNVQLPAGSIDVAFVCDTYHHFEYPQATLQSLRFALRPGGLLVVIDFDRIPGKSREWVLDHVRASKEEFRREIEQAGFVFLDEPVMEGFQENYMLRFRRP